MPESDPKELYTTKTAPMIIQVPCLNFACVHGQGDPNGADFALATSALYSISYAIKMSYKGPHTPEGYAAYKVYPLEGVWDLADKTVSVKDKSNYMFDLMIRQPAFVTPAVFHTFLEETRKKKPNPWLDKMELVEIEEGLCCQMLHLGPYDDEPASFARMLAFCDQQGYVRAEHTHREIYMNDPRRVAPEKIKTILRFKVGLIS